MGFHPNSGASYLDYVLGVKLSYSLESFYFAHFSSFFRLEGYFDALINCNVAT